MILGSLEQQGCSVLYHFCLALLLCWRPHKNSRMAAVPAPDMHVVVIYNEP